MKQSISTTFMLNIVIIFIILVFAFLAGTLSYTKAFRVNSKIVNALEKYEGYNALAKTEIDRILNTLAYAPIGNTKCDDKKIIDGKEGKVVHLDNEYFAYCIYLFENDGSTRHYSYGVQTYIYLELPIVGRTLKLPIFTKTSRIYDFRYN